MTAIIGIQTIFPTNKVTQLCCKALEFHHITVRFLMQKDANLRSVGDFIKKQLLQYRSRLQKPTSSKFYQWQCQRQGIKHYQDDNINIAPTKTIAQTKQCWSLQYCTVKFLLVKTNKNAVLTSHNILTYCHVLHLHRARNKLGKFIPFSWTR